MPSQSRKNSPSAISAVLHDAEFRQLAEIIQKHFGIELHESKKDLIPRRLKPRLKKLGFVDYSQYLSYLNDNWDSEEQTLANAITTNLTSFFREAHHFEYLKNEIMPALLKKNYASKKVRIWSAGCSTGEEPYSIAMVLASMEQRLAGWDIKILASDLDTNILQFAFDGCYQYEIFDKVNGIDCLQYFNTGDDESSIIASNRIKKYIHFKHLNLMESWPMQGGFDIIFCRNVLIYFNMETQKKLIKRFYRLQKPGDHLLIGHSESPQGIDGDYKLIGKTMYNRV